MALDERKDTTMTNMMIATYTATKTLENMPADGLTAEMVLIGIGVGLVLTGVLIAIAHKILNR